MKRTVLLSAIIVSGIIAQGGFARAAMGDNSVGMNTHIPAPEVIDLTVQLGVGWIRVDNNWLQQTDPCSSSIVFMPDLDTRVSYAVGQSLCVYMTLAYTPECASTGDSDNSHHNDVPDPNLYASYVRQSVAHYRAMGVRHFGIWNEPNLEGFFEGNAQQYMDNVVVPGVAAVPLGCADAGYSDCLAMGPDLAHVGEYDEFLEEVLDRMTNAGVSFNILTHHIYQGFDIPIWDGDSFVNALDQRRGFWSRRSFMDVLNDTGWAVNDLPVLEVWITETGYRAQPATDPGEMSEQSDYYMNVITEQLVRDWWTNTFFYEILDSEDEIDGFGITRNQGGGSYLFKPSYTALQARITSEPDLHGHPCNPVEPQCGDGVDNDGDNLTDMEDPGCSDPSDDDEHDSQGKGHTAPYTTGVSLDGDLSEWSQATFEPLSPPGDYVVVSEPAGGSSDISGRFALMWDEAALYLGLEVTDQTHRNDHDPQEIWQSDSIQVALDVGSNGGSGYDDTDDFEYGWALTSSGQQTYRWHAPSSAPSSQATFSVTRSGTTTTYEIRLPAQDLLLSTLSVGMNMGFSVVINDDDGSGRKGYLQWTPGIADSKNPGLFGRLTLGPGQNPDQDGGVDGGGDRDDGGVPPEDGGVGADGSVSVTSSDSGCGCRAHTTTGDEGALSLVVLLLLGLLVRLRAGSRAGF